MGASFVFVTVIVNDWVVDALFESVAVITTLCVPTSLFVGVPERMLVVVFKANQLGIVVPVKLTVSLVGSISVVVIVYVYNESSRTLVTGVLVKLGGSFTLATVIVKDWLTTAQSESSTFNFKLWAPTSLFLGVPDNNPVSLLKFNQSGRTEQLQVYNVRKSPGSSSVNVNW